MENQTSPISPTGLQSPPLEHPYAEATGERLQFEQLLSEIAAALVNVDAEQLDKEITNALARLSAFMGSDLTTFLQKDEATGQLIHTHQWVSPDIHFDLDFTDFDLYQSAPWVARELVKLEPILVSRAADLPEEAESERAIVESTGIKSIVWVPIAVADSFAGCIVLNTIQSEVTWSKAIIWRLRLLGEIFISALQRTRSEQLLNSELQFASLASDLTSRFFNFPVSALGSVMQDALACIAAFVQADRIAIGRLSMSGDWEATYTYSSTSDSALELFPGGPRVWPNLAAHLRRDKVFQFISIDEFVDWPEQGSGIKTAWDQAGCIVRLGVDESGLQAVAITLPKSSALLSQHAIGQLKTLVCIVLDALERQRAEESLKQQVEFEQILSKLSSTFIALPQEETDDRINDALRTIGEHIGADRVFVGQFSNDNSEFRATHLWAAPGVSSDEFAFKVLLSDYAPWCTNQMLSGQPLIFTSIDELPVEAINERAYARKTGIQSSAMVPLIVDKSVVGNFGFDMIRRKRDWSKSDLTQMRLVSEVIGSALKRKRMEQQLRDAHAELKALQERLAAENVYLKQEISADYAQYGILGHSEAIRHVVRQVEQVAGTDASVLISGETGSGKELVARAIHSRSGRSKRTLVKVNCGALPHSLIEAELFGREKGAYTGALSKQAGRFELADGSSIFLDEISELPLELQPKLLRVLQEGEFERLGGGRTSKVDARVIAATNQDLGRAAAEGRFRQDLYYRLNVFPIEVPPLRERREDVKALVWAFVQEFNNKMGKKVEEIPQSTLESLERYAWPGNVRELRNLIERAMIMSTGRVLQVDLAAQSGDIFTTGGLTLHALEKRHIEQTLGKTGWVISGKRGAAELLGLKPTTLRSRMNKLGIHRPDRVSKG